MLVSRKPTLEGEIIGPDEIVTVHQADTPFGMNATTHEIRAGLSITEIFEEINFNYEQAIVEINGHPIFRKNWHRVRPKPGAILFVRPLPEGGGGDDENKTLRTVAALALVVIAIAIIIFAPYTAPLIAGTGITGNALIAGGVLLVGGILINTYIPYKPAAGPDGIEESSPTSFIQGARNDLRPFNVVPVVYGKHRMVPPQGAFPFTETEGNNQYVRQVFVWGYGELEVTDIKIGETDIANFEEVEIETLAGLEADPDLTLFTESVVEETLSVKLDQNVSNIRTTGPDADEISVDITLPQGVYRIDRSGDFRSARVIVKVEYAVAGSGSWVSAGNIAIDRAQTSAIRQSKRFTVARNQYDVRLTKTSTDNPSSNQRLIVETFWSALRTITDEDPLNFDQPLCVTAVRIRATDQLNGAIERLNGIVQAKILDWNGATWVKQATSNPASAFRNVLQGPANSRPLPDSRIDLASLEAWHDYCDTNGFEFNMVRDFNASIRDVLDDICQAGRATVSLNNGKWGVTVDNEKTVVKALVTPNNTSNYRGIRTYPDEFHGLRIRFLNREADWQQDERLVFADGFSEVNATKYESVDLRGITDPEHVYKEGRFIIANTILRPEQHVFAVDAEYLVFQRGDRIRLSHDVPAIGITTSYIKELVDDLVNITDIVLEQNVVFEAGQNHVARIRYADNTQVLENIVIGTQETNTITLVNPIPLAQSPKPEIGDLVAFGVSQLETLDLTVTSIQPAENESATVIATNYDPALFTSDTGVIPPFNSKVTRTAFTPLEQVPKIISVRSDEDALVRDPDGSLRARILIILERPRADLTAITNLQAQYRVNDVGVDDEWVDAAPLQPPDVIEVVVEDVTVGETYDIRLRYLTVDEGFGPWTSTLTATVTGKASPPPPIQALRLEEGVNLVTLRWNYPNRPLDFDHFEVRHRVGIQALWDDATKLPDELVADNTANITGVQRGTRTFMVRARDTSENLSTIVSIVRDLGEAPIDNAVEERSELDLGWPGVLDRGTIVSNELRADDASGELFLPVDTDPFLPDDDELLLPVTYARMTYRVTVRPPAYDFAYSLYVRPLGNFGSYFVEYRRDPDKYLFDEDLLYVNALPDTALYLPGPGTIETEACDVSQTNNYGQLDTDVEFVPEAIERLPDQPTNFNSIRMNHNYPTPAADRKVTIPQNVAYNGLTNSTVMFWARVRDFGITSNFRRLLYKGPLASNGTRMWYWVLDNNASGDLLYDHGNGTTDTALAAGTMSLETWHHIAVTKSGNDFVTYFDTVPVTSQTIASAITSNTNDIIAWAEDDMHWTMDELMIWDRTLTEEEIGFYSVRSPDLDDTNLIGFWPFCLIGPDRAPFPDSVKVRREPIEFLFTWVEGNIATTITDVEFTFDLPDVIDTISDYEVPASETVIPLTKKFNVIKSTTVQLLSGVNVAKVEVLNRDPVKGVTVLLSDSSGDPTTGIIDLEVRGY